MQIIVDTLSSVNVFNLVMFVLIVVLAIAIRRITKDNVTLREKNIQAKKREDKQLEAMHIPSH